jgi:hypothetical protein
MNLWLYHAPHLVNIQLLPNSLIDGIILQIHRVVRGGAS